MLPFVVIGHHIKGGYSMNGFKIKTENGSMTINTDNFFPCSQARFKKLFKVVRRFRYMNDVQAITEHLNRNFTDRISKAEDVKSAYMTLYLSNMQRHDGYNDMVESGKRPDGSPLTKEELKDFRKKQSDAMRSANACIAETRKTEREITALRRNLEMLMGLGM